MRWFLPAILVLGAPAQAEETREDYLARLTHLCAVECLQPRDLQRTARTRGAKDDSDMAVIMDVPFVRIAGDRFELFNIDTSNSPLIDQQILGSAGINTSLSNGIGGRSRGRRANVSPEVVIISISEAAFADVLRRSRAAASAPGKALVLREGEIVVERDRDEEQPDLSLAALRTYFMNRRIVVRGQPVLTPQWVGARRDFRRKQVTLMVDNADDIALLPRYDEDGKPRPRDVPR